VTAWYREALTTTTEAPMKTRLQGTRTEYDLTVEVEDGPILTKQYGKRRFQVEQLRLIFVSVADNTDWILTRVHLSGRYVLKDGTYGVDSTTDELIGRWLGDVAWPELPVIVDKYRPRTAPSVIW
jgi:hypothetical protein